MTELIQILETSTLTGLMTGVIGLAGVLLGTYLQNIFNKKQNQMELKRDILRRFLGFRWQLTLGHSYPDGQFFTALNEILVVFAKDTEVNDELTIFHQAVMNNNFQPKLLQPLAEAMAKSADVPYDGWNKNLFEIPFTPPNDNNPKSRKS